MRRNVDRSGKWMCILYRYNAKDRLSCGYFDNALLPEGPSLFNPFVVTRSSSLFLELDKDQREQIQVAT